MPPFETFAPHPVHYSAGLAFTLISYSLILGGVIGCFHRSPPLWLLRTLNAMCWVLLAASLIVTYAYAREWFAAYFSDSVYERSQFNYRIAGPHAWVFWLTTSSVVAPQAFWIPACRRRPILVLLVAMVAATPHWWLWRDL